MAQLSSPNFLGFINDLTKETKELFDNSMELNNDRQAYAAVVNSVDTTEINEKFVSTVRLSDPRKTPEGQNVGASNSYEGYTTIVSPHNKTTDSITYSFEYEKGKRDNTQKIMTEYNFDAKTMMWGLYNEVNEQFFSLLNNGFTTTLSPDGEVLFSAAHKFTDDVPLVTFDNLMAAAAPSLAVLEELQRRAGAFTDLGGRPMALNPKIILVKKGGKAFTEWSKILNPDRYAPTSITGANGVNIYEVGGYRLVECVYITSNTAYFFMEDYNYSNLKNPLYLAFHQRPTIYGMEDKVDTLTHQTTYVSYYKTAVINIPLGMFGSVGA